MLTSQRLLPLLPVLFVSLILQPDSAYSENTPLPKMKTTAIGAIHPRLSPEGKAVVFSWQGSTVWKWNCIKETESNSRAA